MSIVFLPTSDQHCTNRAFQTYLPVNFNPFFACSNTNRTSAVPELSSLLAGLIMIQLSNPPCGGQLFEIRIGRLGYQPRKRPVCQEMVSC